MARVFLSDLRTLAYYTLKAGGLRKFGLTARVCQNQDLSDLWDFQDFVFATTENLAKPIADKRMRGEGACGFVRIRIYRIYGIFRILFRRNRKSRQAEY